MKRRPFGDFREHSVGNIYPLAALLCHRLYYLLYSRDIVVLRHYKRAYRFPRLLPQYPDPSAILHRPAERAVLGARHNILCDSAIILVKCQIMPPYLLKFLHRGIIYRQRVAVLRHRDKSPHSDTRKFDLVRSSLDGIEPEALTAIKHLCHVKITNARKLYCIYSVEPLPDCR